MQQRIGCPGTSARERFLRACISTDCDEATSMIDGMLPSLGT
jgi:hypothetical protein